MRPMMPGGGSGMIPAMPQIPGGRSSRGGNW
jgi:hypothetical protein